MTPTERLKGIEVFVSTADAGSFTAAAARLNLTTSAVSKSVARLEARLGTRLFERTTRSLALTDTGEAFYRTCTRISRISRKPRWCSPPSATNRPAACASTFR